MKPSRVAGPIDPSIRIPPARSGSASTSRVVACIRIPRFCAAAHTSPSAARRKQREPATSSRVQTSPGCAPCPSPPRLVGLDRMRPGRRWIFCAASIIQAWILVPFPRVKIDSQIRQGSSGRSHQGRPPHVPSGTVDADTSIPGLPYQEADLRDRTEQCLRERATTAGPYALHVERQRHDYHGTRRPTHRARALRSSAAGR